MSCPPKLWLIIDVILYILLLGLGVSLGTMSLVTPMMAPISCSDPALQSPLSEDTLSIKLVIVLCTILPAIEIFLIELVLAASDGTAMRRGTHRQGCHQTINTAFRRTMLLTWDLLVGELFAFCLMEILKITTGMPRPHFWDSCGGIDRQKELCKSHENGFVTVDLLKCPNPHKLKWPHLADAAKSFPSGHSCLAVFITVYMTVYIFQRLRPRNPNDTGSGNWQSVARKWLPFPWFVMACLVATSRLWDQRHHWWDLVGGGVLGAIMAVFTVTIITGTFRRVSEWSLPNRDMVLARLNGGTSPEPESP